MPEREYYVWDKEGEEEPEWIKFYYFSESYRKAFLTLLAKEEKNEDSVYFDEDILPVLMNFSQYLELIFKALLIKANVLINELIGHNPKEIYEKVKEVYPDFILSESSLLFIEDFNWINEFGQSLRYPVSSRGQRLWLHGTEGRHFLLNGIASISKQVMGEIYNYLKLKTFIP
jgi:hypothetical protein